MKIIHNRAIASPLVRAGDAHAPYIVQYTPVSDCIVRLLRRIYLCERVRTREKYTLYGKQKNAASCVVALHRLLGDCALPHVYISNIRGYATKDAIGWQTIPIDECNCRRGARQFRL